MPHAVIRIPVEGRSLLEDHQLVRIRSMFADLAHTCIGHRVVLYQSVRQSHLSAEDVGYFATAEIERVLPQPDNNGYHPLFLIALEPIEVSGFAAKPQSQAAFEPISGWAAAADVREITAAEFTALTGKSGRDDVGFERTTEPMLLPRFRMRLQSVRDRTFREAVYRAYRGQCAISKVTLLGDSGVCGLQAAHIVRHRYSPHQRASAGILLAPSWHDRFDRGAIVISDDYTWSPIDEDFDTLAIEDRRLLLPLSTEDWPDRALLAQRRARRGVI